jgi:hypothetical protein
LNGDWLSGHWKQNKAFKTTILLIDDII